MDLNVVVIGLGKLGLPIACCFGEHHPVYGIDTNFDVVSQINAGLCPWDEPGLAKLVEHQTVTATEDYKVVNWADVIVIIVPTPSLADSSFSNEYVLDVFTQMGPYMKSGQTVVISSTVMPGACEKILCPDLAETSAMQANYDFGLIYSPEFVALGDVIKGFQFPDMVLIGSFSGDPESFHAARYESLIRSVVGEEVPVNHMKWTDAEITKLSINTFLSVKIAYANLLAQISSRIGGNVEVITEAIGQDSRIGRKFLSAGLPAGGTCLPRDVRAFRKVLKDLRIVPKLPDAIMDHNRAWLDDLLALIITYARNGKRVGVLGISYKPNTPVTEESYGLRIAEELTSISPVYVYDPKAYMSSGKLFQVDTAQECVDNCDIVVICTQEEEFKTVDLKSKTTIDIWGIREENWVIRPGRTQGV